MRVPQLLTPNLLTLLLSLPLSSHPAPLDDGLTAFTAGNDPPAYTLWKPLAEADDAKARYNLGLMFQQGLGVESNPQQARLLFAAARQGDAAEHHPRAQYNLGALYAYSIA